MFDFVQKRRWYYLASGILVGLAIAVLVFSTVQFGQPVRLSIDFTGGSRFVLVFDAPATEEGIRDVFTDFDYVNPIVQQLGTQDENTWQVRTREVREEDVAAILNRLSEDVAPVNRDLTSIGSVSPAIGNEVTRAAGLAILVASVIILLFIWWSFRRVPHALRYGVAAIVGMMQNLIITFGFYALMGILQGWEADALFLTAVLTVIGFSVQDVIVVFDRIRENIPRHRGEPYETIVNRSILETIHRSLATQLNAMFVMIAILLFGGDSIKPFIATMLVGMVSETYSSMFTAVPLLVSWEQARGKKQVEAVPATA